jgi:hypothetical protein
MGVGVSVGMGVGVGEGGVVTQNGGRHGVSVGLGEGDGDGGGNCAKAPPDRANQAGTNRATTVRMRRIYISTTR